MSFKDTHVNLSDGRQLNYHVHFSSRARSLRLKMTAKEGLTVVAPLGLDESKIVEIINNKRDWIRAKLDQFEEVRQLLGEQRPVRPEAFDLSALAESWRVEYQLTKSKTVGARTERQGRVLVYGATNDDDRCKIALRRWLARRAKDTMTPWLEAIATKNQLHFSQVIIKNQRTRWGSHSANGVISLNAKLLFLSPQLVRYVMLHELCHGLEHNHTMRFWTHLKQFEPQTDLLHSQMREAWKLVPSWAHPVQADKENIL